MSRGLLRAAGLLALAALLGAGGAAAQGLDLSHGGPVEVTARDGIDWLKDQQEIVARGDARAVRANVTVTADTLIAFYRKKAQAGGAAANAGGGKQPVTAAAATTSPDNASPGSDPAAAGAPPGPVDDTENSEVYRLEAIGHVHVFTPTDQAWGDHAVYDMDQAVLVLTGHELKLTTPQDVLTARDDMEYWSQKRMSVARGNAVVVTTDGRRIAADTLVGYSAAAAPSPSGATAKKPAAAAAGKPPADPLLASGKLQRVEAFGNASVRTATETVHGDRGVYVPDTGKARIVGHVRITRGQNQMNGVAADVDLKSGVSTLLSGPSERAEGLIMPNEARAGAPGSAPDTSPGGAGGPKPGSGGPRKAKP